MKHKEIILLLASIFIIVVAWISFSIYHNLATSTTPSGLDIETISIKSSFDEPAIKKLRERKQILPLFQFERPSPTPTTPEPSPTFIPTPEASPSSSEDNLTPTASQGGQLGI